jgi:hypothetical protein
MSIKNKIEKDDKSHNDNKTPEGYSAHNLIGPDEDRAEDHSSHDSMSGSHSISSEELSGSALRQLNTVLARLKSFVEEKVDEKELKRNIAD